MILGDKPLISEVVLSQKHAILDTMLLADADNSDSCHTKKWDLQHDFLWMFRWFTHQRSPSSPTASA
jgi:hypothetical protein